MEPTEALVLVAELGVALVAAAGIVTAIGGRSRDYSPGDRARIRQLIAIAATPLAVALVALTMLSAQVPPERTWSLASLGYAALIVGLSALGTSAASQLRQPTAMVRRRTGVILALAAGVLLLLLYNGLVLWAFWPVLLACSFHLLGAVLLVLVLLLEDA